jgi:hypothetical protein
MPIDEIAAECRERLADYDRDNERSMEQMARDWLDREGLAPIGEDDCQAMSSGEIVGPANLIAIMLRTRRILDENPGIDKYGVGPLIDIMLANTIPRGEDEE